MKENFPFTYFLLRYMLGFLAVVLAIVAFFFIIFYVKKKKKKKKKGGGGPGFFCLLKTTRYASGSEKFLTMYQNSPPKVLY